MLTELSIHHRLEICGPLWPTCLLPALQTPIIFPIVFFTWKSSSLKCPPHTLAVSDKGSVKFKSRLWIHWNRNYKIKYILRKAKKVCIQKQWRFTCIRRTGSLGNLNIPSLALFLHPSTIQGWTMISPPPPTGDLEMCPFSSLDSFVSQMTSLLFAEVELDV